MRGRTSITSRLFNTAMSHRRVKMCLVNQDIITAMLWAISGYDPALVHFAELRETLRQRHTPNSDAWTSFERALLVYLNAQCGMVLEASGMDHRERDCLISTKIGHGHVGDVITYATACHQDPELVSTVVTYTLYLSILTSHGLGPWKRLASTVEESYRMM